MFSILTMFLVAVSLQQATVKGQEFEPNVPSECEALGYCDGPLPDYPSDAVNKVVTESGLVSPDIVDVTKSEARRQDPGEVNLCEYDERIILPQAAKDTSGKWTFIANTQDFKQGYRVQICKNANSQCSSTAHFQSGYSASCQQKFISVVMVSLDPNGNKSDKDYKIPSSCYCQVNQEM